MTLKRYDADRCVRSSTEVQHLFPKIVAVQQDDGSWAAYDDDRFEGDTETLKVGRGDTRDEALNDLVDALEWTDAGKNFVRRAVFALAARFS